MWTAITKGTRNTYNDMIIRPAPGESPSRLIGSHEQAQSTGAKIHNSVVASLVASRLVVHLCENWGCGTAKLCAKNTFGGDFYKG